MEAADYYDNSTVLEFSKERSIKFQRQKNILLIHKNLYGLCNFLRILIILNNDTMSLFLCQSVILPFLMFILTI